MRELPCRLYWVVFRKLRFLLVFCGCLIFAACRNDVRINDDRENSGRGVTLCTWNLQTFFDSVKEGTEYTEFVKSENWNKDAYITRLVRLTEMMKSVDADVYVFEEIENEAVIQDISNQLAGKAWDPNYNWSYACFSKESGSSIGCGVLSRFPLIEMKNHSLDVRTGEKMPSMRPLLEVVVEVDSGCFSLFVNHWKSKSGGVSETEIWRDWQEAVLGRKLEGVSRAVCAGDFNRDINDFVQDNNQVVLRVSGFGDSWENSVENPWITGVGEPYLEIGSYVFQNQWERIDHIMTYGDIYQEGFHPVAQDPWCDEKKYPVPYKLYTGYGYSDHLPLWTRLIF